MFLIALFTKASQSNQQKQEKIMNKSSTPQLYFHGQFNASVATGNNAEEINIFNADTQINKDPVHVFDMTQVQVIDPIQFETKSGQQVNLTMETY